ncbi:hypothetical protein [Roseibium aggregatum]|uniref:CHAT domain-containing protein n=1 Tax=Roseibium aggregatum TaxID=187304 RepID=A0A939EB71_9HYPH|nr:hypothetical protein [Roseibium aggregatum]MBN9669738.1 hypothetical protein [Roseibium aggregatum]
MTAETFFNPQHPVTLIAIGDSGEAMTLRLILESLGAFVSFYRIGTPGDFVSVLSSAKDPGNLTVISAHGNNGGFHFGDYAPQIDTSLLKSGVFVPSSVPGIGKLSRKTFLSTACETGSSEMRSAFLEAGADAYVAPERDPEGRDIPVFVHLFAHGLLAKGLTVSAAFDAACDAVKDAGMVLAQSAS